MAARRREQRSEYEVGVIKMGMLAGKAALVTGGSRGIGAAIVERLAREGANVALTYVSRADCAEATAEKARGYGAKALALRADSADAGAVVAAVERTVSELGGLDILVNNAGVAWFAPLEAVELAAFDQLVAVNVRAVFVAAQAAARRMKPGGRIIVIGSGMADRVPMAGCSVYAMSKAAVAGLVRGLARDLGPRGITVNNVQPGPVDTEMNPADSDYARATVEQMLAVPRYGRGDEVAAMVAYLAGPEADFVTGASLTIDGGYSA